MPQGVRANNLPTSSDVIELVGIKDMGGGARKVVRIALVDLLAWLETAFGVVAARAAADTARAIGLANNANLRARVIAGQLAAVAADARRALGDASNANIRVRALAASVVRVTADAARALGHAQTALTRIRLLDASIARVSADTRRALGLANNVSNRVSHLDDVQIVLRTQVFS
jgi:hypothetical protein